MRNSLCLYFLLLIVVFSCKKTDNNLLIADGTYTGTFRRLIADTGRVSHISITFSAGKWTGQSDSSKYPALCNGSYIVNGENNIKFLNGCAWTADFDPTYILDGQFHLQMTDSTLTLERNYTGAAKDIYQLVKP